MRYLVLGAGALGVDYLAECSSRGGGQTLLFLCGQRARPSFDAMAWS